MKPLLFIVLMGALATFSLWRGSRHQYDLDKDYEFHLKWENDSLKDLVNSANRDRDNCMKMYQQEVNGLKIVKDALDSTVMVIYIDKKMIDAIERRDYPAANLLRIRRNSLMGDIYLFHLK